LKISSLPIIRLPVTKTAIQSEHLTPPKFL
jgi:hypothetical protein